MGMGMRMDTWEKVVRGQEEELVGVEDGVDTVPIPSRISIS